MAVSEKQSGGYPLPTMPEGVTGKGVEVVTDGVDQHQLAKLEQLALMREAARQVREHIMQEAEAEAPGHENEYIDSQVADVVETAARDGNFKEAAAVGIPVIASPESQSKAARALEERVPLGDLGAELAMLTPDEMAEATRELDEAHESVSGVIGEASGEQELSPGQQAIQALRLVRLRAAEDMRRALLGESPEDGLSLGFGLNQVKERMHQLLEVANAESDLSEVASIINESIAFERGRDIDTYGDANGVHEDYEVEEVVAALSPDVMRRIINSGHGGALAESLKGAMGRQKHWASRAVAKAYGYDSVTKALMRPEAREMIGEGLLDTMRQYPEVALREMTDRIPDRLAASEEMRRIAASNATSDYLIHILGIPEELSDEMEYAMRGRISSVRSGGRDISINPKRLYNELSAAAEVVRHMSPDDMMELRREAGIVNFANISMEQLQTTLGLVRGDSEIIQHLQGGDSSVFIGDAMDDWNGAGRGEAEKLSGATARNVVFELSELGDNGEGIARYVALLERHGINPSTLILSGHGEPGRMHIGGGTLNYKREDGGVSVADSAAFRGLLARLKPSKETGMSTIILQSCSQASTGSRVPSAKPVGVSTAMRIARVAGEEVPTPVGVYASPIPTNMRRYEDGSLSFLGPKNGATPRPPQEDTALYMTLPDKGTTMPVRMTVDKVILDKSIEK